MIEYGTISNSQEEQQLLTIISQCFGSSLEESQKYLQHIGKENVRLIRQKQTVMGGLAIYHMGQWYGGQCVPMAGIAAVGVAPEYRGTGAAYHLLRCTVQKLYDLGVPISALYPATQVLYRKVGYEQAGSYCQWELPTASLQIKGNDLPIHPIIPPNAAVFQDIYTQKAKINNGHLERHPFLWENIVNPLEKQTVYAYLLGEQQQGEGYIIFTQYREQNTFRIAIIDWAVLTQKAAERFWSFIASHRSQIKQVRWRGSTFDPALLLLPEQTYRLIRRESWMLRVINVPLALSKRGYPWGIETELHLDIKDELILDNNGKMCLKISQGRGEVTRGGKGDLKIDIRGLASLYSGFLSPTQLQFLGYLQATPEALAIATLLFTGSSPWMPDFF